MSFMFRPSVFDSAGGGGSAPGFIAAGAVAAGASAIQVSWPEDHQALDIGILLVQTYNQALPSVPNGCSLIIADQYVAFFSKTRLAAYRIRATSSAMPAIQVADSGDHQIAVILNIRGCVASGNPVVASSSDNAASGTAITVPGVTTPIANALVIAAVGFTNPTNNHPSVSGWTNGNLTGIVEAVDSAARVNNGGGIAAACGVKATAGATGGTTATLSVAEAQARLCIALAGA